MPEHHSSAQHAAAQPHSDKAHAGCGCGCAHPDAAATDAQAPAAAAQATTVAASQEAAATQTAENTAETAAEAPATEEADLISALQADLAAAQEEQAKTKDSLLRTYAELENLRRRLPEDIKSAQDRAVGQFAQSLLPVMDSLEAALGQESQTLDDLRTGVELTLKQLQQAFERNQLNTVAPQVGDTQDPNLHQAIQAVPHDTVASEGVVHVVQKGYTLGKRVLRPAMVVVSTGKASEA